MRANPIQRAPSRRERIGDEGATRRASTECDAARFGLRVWKGMAPFIVDVKRATTPMGPGCGVVSGRGGTAAEKMNRRASHASATAAAAARAEHYARRATELARAHAEARSDAEETSKELRRERERANAATAACQSLRRELSRAQRLNLDADRRARAELERGAKARKALVEMIQELKHDVRSAKDDAKASGERARMMEEWAKRRDLAATHAVERYRRCEEERAVARRRIQVVTEENVRLRRAAERHRVDYHNIASYTERLESEWTAASLSSSPNAADGETPRLIRNPVFETVVPAAAATSR